MNKADRTRQVFTIGHSTRPIGVFVELLLAHEVTSLADVRTIPKSRHNPQYNEDALREALRSHDIEYMHIADLGGLRHASKTSINGGWKNASFRGYADYMQTHAFAEAVDDLIESAKTRITAIMCAEAVPWRCHRSLIADALTVRGVTACHIVGEKRTQKHALTPFAKVEGLRITYPAAQA